MIPLEDSREGVYTCLLATRFSAEKGEKRSCAMTVPRGDVLEINAMLDQFSVNAKNTVDLAFGKLASVRIIDLLVLNPRRLILEAFAGNC
jgi:hypothetical protein